MSAVELRRDLGLTNVGIFVCMYLSRFQYMPLLFSIINSTTIYSFYQRRTQLRTTKGRFLASSISMEKGE
jgi:hypothetical protein